MSKFIKPKIVISKCIEFAHCRHDGQIIANEFVDKMKEKVNFIPVCPEVEIGLGTPRPSLRLVSKNKGIHLIQPETGHDLTETMHEFIDKFLKNLPEIEGFVMQNRSPTCGHKDTKLYLPDNKNPLGKTSGIFTKKIKKKYPDLPLEDGGRLTNFKIREHFLTTIFTLAQFRKIKKEKSISDLVKFQSQNKLLFLAYNEPIMRRLGQIAANPDPLSPTQIFEKYEKNLEKVFSEPASYTASINVLMHAFGHISDNLSSREKDFFLNSLEKYKKNKVPLSVPSNILQTWIIKYDNQYLQQQSFFEPYPEELIEIKDSGQGR